jgi:RNA polymerase sigma factor (sigma-70 family)
MPEPHVFIVDDDEAFRDSVKELVNSVGLAAQTFRSAPEFLAAYDPARPGCLVLDVRMARMGGIELQATLKSMDARIPIVMISGHGDIAMAVEAIKQGAIDFVQKPYREQHLLDAINEALRRDAAQRGAANGAGAFAERIAALTPRERQVMDLALKGLPSKVIAKQLAISHRTVEQHRSRLLEKLGLHSMTELMRLAYAPRRD